MQSITFYNYTSDEHGSEGACIIFIQSLIKSQKQPLILYNEFEPNSRETVLKPGSQYIARDAVRPEVTTFSMGFAASRR